MRIYQLTAIGDGIASSPSHQVTPALKVLYFLRRKGGRATDEQLKQFVVSDPSQYQNAISALVRQRAITSM